jgi:hypothetical protein
MPDIIVQVSPPAPVVIQVAPPPPVSIAVSTSGPQGPPGPAGPVGGSPLVFTQITPAASWAVNHNRGRRVSVTVLSPGGVEVDAAVTNVSDNQVQIDFAAPASGQAIII